MVSYQSSQPRRDSCRLHLLNILRNFVLKASLEYSQSRAEDEEVVLRDHVTWSRCEAGELHGDICPGEVPELVSPEEKGIAIMCSVSSIKLFPIELDIGVAVFAVL